MWSCIIYNKKEKKFSISRDRLGINHCGILRRKINLFILSDVKSILNIIHNDIIIDKNTVLDFCKYGFLDEDNHTFFKNIKVFPKGSVSK